MTSEWRVKSANGVTGGGYRSRAAAGKAADRLNAVAPGQGWEAWFYEDEAPKMEDHHPQNMRYDERTRAIINAYQAGGWDSVDKYIRSIPAPVKNVIDGMRVPSTMLGGAKLD